MEGNHSKKSEVKSELTDADLKDNGELKFDVKGSIIKTEDDVKPNTSEESREANDQDEVVEYSSEEENIENEEEPVVEHLDSAPLYRDPIFAEIVSFFNNFAHLLGVKQMSIQKLEELFCTFVDGKSNQELVSLHVTLMRKIYLKSARVEKWEAALQKFCSIAPGMEREYRQLQRHNYVDIPLASKLTILKALCDSQFDWTVKFKENIANSFRHNELRLSPIGSDKTGQLYYFQLDCDLAFRVYSEEPEDMAGTSWALKASNDTELVSLIETLKNPEFGRKTLEEEEEEQKDAEIDEDQLLNQSKEGDDKKMQLDKRPSSTASISSKAPIIQLTEEDRAKVQMECRLSRHWDRYQKDGLLNKRKLEREKHKRERLTAKNAKAEEIESTEGSEEKTGESLESKEENEKTVEKFTVEEEQFKIEGKKEEQSQGEAIITATRVENAVNKVKKRNTPELDETFLAQLEAEDRRRILPRRSARNTAMLNIKVFTTSPRKRNDSEPLKTGPSNAQKMGFVVTAGSCSEDESDQDDGEEEDEEAEDSSDDDFILDDDGKRIKVSRIGRPPTKKNRPRPLRGGKAGAKGKKKKRNQKGRLIGRLPVPSLMTVHRLQKQQTIAFVEEESSDDGEMEEETKQEKERKKATEQTLCQRCQQSKRPDLLLLCDSCDDAWHTFCLRPQLWYVPDGDWFCPICEHASLLRRLSFALVTVQDERKTRDQNLKKAAAADRLKREMDYMNNIPLTLKNEEQKFGQSSSEEDEDEEEDQKQRKSKKRAMKIVMSRTRQQKKVEKWYSPVVTTIAEGRSRRTLNKVDYNFRSYDEQLQEAMELSDSDKVKQEESSITGNGRGKDMQNIMDADRNREEEEAKVEPEKKVGERNENAPARPPKGTGTIRKGARKNKRLTDLDIDNATESDTDEWKENSAEEMEEDPDPDPDEWLPSERRKAYGPRYDWNRHASDDEFINDDSDPDYIVNNRKKKSGLSKGGRRVVKGRGKRRAGKRHNSSSTSEEEEELQLSENDDSDAAPSTQKKRKIVEPIRINKWAPKAKSSSEENEEEEESGKKMTKTGRPLRKAAANVKKKLIEQIEDEEEEEEEKNRMIEEEKPKEGETSREGRLADRAVNAFAKPFHTGRKEEADEFQPDEEEEVAADEEEKEAEEELAKVQVDDEAEEEEDKEMGGSSQGEDEEESEEEEEAHVLMLKGKRRAPPPRTAPPQVNKNVGNRRGKMPKPMALSRQQSGRNKKYAEANGEESMGPAGNELSTKSAIKRKLAETNVPSTSKVLPVLAQRQTRQQLRKQQSTEANNTITNIPTSPTATSSLKKEKQQRPQIFAIKAELEQEIPIKESPVYLSIPLEKSKNPPKVMPKEDEAKARVCTEHTVTVIGQSPKKNSTKSKILNSGKSAIQSNVAVSLSRVAIPSTSNVTVASSPRPIFQPVHPQQLSQYFLQPSANTPPQPSQLLAVVTTNPPRAVSIANSISLPRFTMRSSQITTNISYTLPHQEASISNGGPSFVTVAPPTHHLASGTMPQFPPHSQPTIAPQIIYQTLQPYVMHHPTSSSQSQMQHRIQSGPSDSDSLSHVLAGAMNPEDL